MTHHNHTNPGMYAGLPCVQVETTDDLRESISVSRERDLSSVARHLRIIVGLVSGGHGWKDAAINESALAALRSLGGEG